MRPRPCPEGETGPLDDAGAWATSWPFNDSAGVVVVPVPVAGDAVPVGCVRDPARS
jgi:hypothetical protein